MSARSAALAAALLLMAPAASAAPAPATSAEIPAGYFEIIEPVAPHVWAIRQADPFHLQPIGNVTVIEQADGLVLVDSGGSPGSGRRIVRLVKSVSSKPVKAVVLTHWHGDHPLGVPAIRAEWPGAQVIATARTAEHLAGKPMAFYAKGAPDAAKSAEMAKRLDGFDTYIAEQIADPRHAPPIRAGWAAAGAEMRRYREDVKDLHLILPDRSFEDRLLLADAQAPVELVHPGRGNTDGDAIAWLPRQKVLVTGDLVVAPVPFGFGSYPADWLATIEKLKARDFAVLIPGHGAPQRDRLYLDRLAALIAEVRAQVAPLAARGLPLAEVRKQVDLTAHRRMFAGDDPWLSLWFDQYWTQPFVEAAWKEARGEPIPQGSG